MGDKKCTDIIQEAINIRKDDKAKMEWLNTKEKWSKEVTLLENNPK